MVMSHRSEISSVECIMLTAGCCLRVGEQATFCWRLERLGAADASMLVAYDAFADAEAWSPAGVRGSYVALPAGPSLSQLFFRMLDNYALTCCLSWHGLFNTQALAQASACCWQ